MNHDASIAAKENVIEFYGAVGQGRQNEGTVRDALEPEGSLHRKRVSEGLDCELFGERVVLFDYFHRESRISFPSSKY